MSPRRIVFLLALVLVLGARAYTAAHAGFTAVDGRQYLALASELRARGHFAFSADEPPTYSRLPGYPLVLSLLDVGRSVPCPSAALLNLLFDLLGAVAIGALVRAWLGATQAGIAMLLVLTSPLLCILSLHVLTESLAVLLGVLVLTCAFFAARRGSVALAACAGLSLGAAQLVRADSVTLVLPLAMVLWMGVAPRAVRLRQLALCALVAAAVFAPWPARNLAELGEARPFAAYWRTIAGRPLPDGPLVWARAYGHDVQLENGIDPAFAFEVPLPRDTMLSLVDPDERAATAAVIDAYDKQGLTPEVDAAFGELGRAHRRRHPWSTLRLPLVRLHALYRSVSWTELTIEAPALGLVGQRRWVRIYDVVLYLAALVGLVRLVRARQRFAYALLVLWLSRMMLLGWTVPLGLSQRHFAELFPWLIVCAVAALSRLPGPTPRSPS